MTRLAFLSITVVFLATGCTGVDPTGPGLPEDVAFLIHQGPRPWQATSEGTATLAGLCAGGAGGEVAISGTGTGTHVGRFSVTMTMCFDFSSGLPIGNPTATLTAANGDEIYMLLSGGTYVDITTGETVSFYEITGGSGRFDGAHGAFTNRGITDQVSFVWSNRSEGWITY